MTAFRICKNQKCSNYNKMVVYAHMRYKIDSAGNFIPQKVKCPICGEYLSCVEKKNTEIPNITIGEFNGMSLDKKKEVLKKRADFFNKKDDAQGKREYYRNKVIKNFFGQ